MCDTVTCTSHACHMRSHLYHMHKGGYRMWKPGNFCMWYSWTSHARRMRTTCESTCHMRNSLYRMWTTGYIVCDCTCTSHANRMRNVSFHMRCTLNSHVVYCGFYMRITSTLYVVYMRIRMRNTCNFLKILHVIKLISHVKRMRVKFKTVSWWFPESDHLELYNSCR